MSDRYTLPLSDPGAELATVGGKRASLAHGSIVAREYGIPAVMGTGRATQRIKSCELIRVDGDRGTVTLVDQVDAAQVDRIEARRVVRMQAAARKRKAVLALVAGTSVALVLWWRKRRVG